MRPTRSVTWVVGAGGLLGRHVLNELGASGHDVMTISVPWHDTARASRTLRSGLTELRGRADGAAGWNIAWCAGAGVVATSPAELAAEGDVFTGFLADVKHVLSTERDVDGAFFLASSAGGLYAGGVDPPFTESTTPKPLAPYGDLKLAMESELVALGRTTGLPILIGRIANLYGPGQRIDKPHGLVTQLCKAHFTRKPVSIYVSLDTIRDYLAVGDCAAMVVAGLASLREYTRDKGDSVVVKVFASGRATTIGGLVGECSRVLRRRPPIVLASSPDAAMQVRDLRLRSRSWPELDQYVRTPLAAGVALTAQDVGYRIRKGAR